MRHFSKDYKKVTCIYKITSPSAKVYIGQTWDLGHRYRSGISKGQTLLFRSYEKYGEDAHKCEILMTFNSETTTQKDLDDWEIYYMKKHQLDGVELLNIREGGSRGKLPPETLKKLAEAFKKWATENPELAKATTQKAILANTGAKRSNETKALMSASASGKTRTDEHNANISKAKTGKTSPMKGKKMSERALENVRAAAKNREQTNLRPIKQFSTDGEFIKEWPSIISAANELGIYKGNIAACVAKRKHALTAGGFIWQYAEDMTAINPADYIQEFKPKQTKVAQMMGETIIKVYNSVKEAALATGTDRPGIFSCISGKQKKAGGYNWQKIN